jgi:hypothetical protein
MINAEFYDGATSAHCTFLPKMRPNNLALAIANYAVWMIADSVRLKIDDTLLTLIFRRWK